MLKFHFYNLNNIMVLTCKLNQIIKFWPRLNQNHLEPDCTLCTIRMLKTNSSSGNRTLVSRVNAGPRNLNQNSKSIFLATTSNKNRQVEKAFALLTVFVTYFLGGAVLASWNLSGLYARTDLAQKFNSDGTVCGYVTARFPGLWFFKNNINPVV